MRSEFSELNSCVVTWKWIYIFHMPLFIFISGYFSRKKKKAELTASIWKLLEPLIVFQALTLLPRFIVKGFSFSAILTPWYVLWYLLSLIYWRLLIQIIPDRFLNNTKLIIIITFCISILAGFLPFNRFLSIQRTLSFMPFFFLGYCMKGKNLFITEKYKSLSFVFLILMTTIPLLFPQLLGDLKQADPYDKIYGALQRMFAFCLAIPMSIAFINICPNKPWVARQGKMSMQYYIYHAFIIPPLIVITSKLNITMSFIYAVVLTFIITIGISIASYSTYFCNFTNPSSFLKNGNINKL